MLRESRKYRIGDIYMVRFEGYGNEQNGYRPCIIFQNNTGNAFSPNVIVFPITSQVKKVNMPTHVVVNPSESGLDKVSMILCENPECISKFRLGQFVGAADKRVIEKVAEASVIATGAIAFINPSRMAAIRDASLELNYAA